MTTFAIIALSLLGLAALSIGVCVAYLCWKYYGSYELSSCASKEEQYFQSVGDKIHNHFLSL